MINELFEIFPEYIAFQILTYRPHPDAIIISEYWDKIRYNRRKLFHFARGYRNVISEIMELVADMNDVEEETGVSMGGFDGYYMNNVSPNMFSNIYG